MKNKLYTKSYFKKRLIEKGFNVSAVNCSYSLENDLRYWTLIINPKKESIWITCYKKTSEDFWFRFNTAYNSNIFLRTMSMDIISDTLTKLIKGPININDVKEDEENQ